MNQDDAVIRILPTGNEAAAVPTTPLLSFRASQRQLLKIRRRFMRRFLALGRRAASTAGRRLVGNLREARGTARAALTSPFAALMVGIVAAGVAFRRLSSGKPLEGTGEELNRLILGDTDDRARALRHTREYMEAHDEAMLAVGRAGSVPEDIANVGLSYYRRELVKERGLSRIREAFPVDSYVDMVIARSAEGVKAIWKEVVDPAIGYFVAALKKAPTANTKPGR